MTVKIEDQNRIPELVGDLAYIERARIRVGVFGKDDSFTVMLANVHEYGIKIRMTDKMRRFLFAQMNEAGIEPSGGDGNGYVNIPERSFLRSAFDQNESRLFDEATNMLGAVLSGQLSGRALMNRIGNWLVGMVQRQMKDVKQPSLSELTLSMRRKGKGSGSPNPLLDEGRLWQSISYEVDLL